MAAPIVFFDIAGLDSPGLRKFYATVFGWECNGSGNFTTPVIAPLPGTIRQGAAEKILYIGVSDVSVALAQIVAEGGTIDAPRFEVKGVVVLGLFRDPAGNRMGLVEMLDGKPVIP